jgi:glycosyltransferase involved in cell wall biosynthesis
VTEKHPLSRRVLQIFNRYLERGGEEVWVANLENSFQLPTCYFNSSDWTGPNAPGRLSQALRMINNPASLRKLRRLQEDTKAEVWVVQNAFPTGSAAIYREAEKLRVPLIQYVHNFRPFCVSGYLRPVDLKDLGNRSKMFVHDIRRVAWRNSRLRTTWFAMVLTIAHMLRWFDAITAWIAVSDFMRNQFIRAGVPSEKIFTLRHFWRPIADLGSTTDQDYYLFIGRLVELKGVLALVDVWDRIFNERKTAAPKIVIIGEGELDGIVRSRAGKNPLIDFRGSVSREQKQQLLTGMRALIAPSLCLESLGFVAYEAYDFAKPVLASRSGGLAEIVLHDRTGFVHEPGDTGALFDHIMNLEGEPTKRRELGQNAREWLLTNADENQWRKRFAEIIEFAIATKR